VPNDLIYLIMRLSSTISWDSIFSSDALFESDRFRRKEGREIKPLTLREIMDEEIATK
jgi:hypothetical protein